MNTISSVRPYMNLKNNPQVPATQPQTPAFKGVIGKRVVEEIVYNKPLTIASILAMVGGVIGLSKDKVSDVLEELTLKIKSLMGEKAELESQNLELKKTLVNTKAEKDRTEQSLALAQEQLEALRERNTTEMVQKDARIAELEGYAAMAKVKSIGEIDTVMPDQFLATLQEIEGHNEAAHNSLLDFVMTGKGQEEFLAQMERNNILLKGKKDGIDKIPEVGDALEKAQQNVGLRWLACDSYCLACTMLGNVLKVQPKASYIQSPAIYAQVKANAEALIEPMMDKRFTYYESIDKEMIHALDYHKVVSEATKAATSQKGLEYISETIVENSPNKSYRTFKNSDGNFVDYSLNSLYACFWGESRIRTPEGEIIRDDSRIK